MNIKKMLEAQKELDEANLKKGGLTEYPLEMVQTAYRVELGELLQEWKQFKFWKLNKGKVNREKMLEEWADCMHFALSLNNNIYKCKSYTYDDFRRAVEYEKILDIYKVINDCFSVNMFTLSCVIALGLKLGYTLEELEQAYWRKNKINWERIEGGY